MENIGEDWRHKTTQDIETEVMAELQLKENKTREGAQSGVNKVSTSRATFSNTLRRYFQGSQWSASK